MKRTLSLLLACLCSYLSLYAQASHQLDSAFAHLGIYMGDTGACMKIALQPDGKIIVAGGEVKTGGQTLAMRFHSNGVIDSSFGQDGRFYKPLISADVAVNDLCLEPGGKIVLAGRADTGNTRSDFFLLRLKSDGTADSSFGGGGYVISSYDQAPDTLVAIALQSDGKVVAYGHFSAGQDTLQVVRYHTDGRIDSSFSLNGRAKLYQGFTNAVPNDIAVMADGRIVVGGHADINASSGAFIAVRLLSDGSLDTSFNHTGLASTDAGLGILNSQISYYSDVMSLQSDGKVLLAGRVYQPGHLLDTVFVARLATSGLLDNSFGNNGIAGLYSDPNIFIAPPKITISDMFVRPDGKIALGVNNKLTSFPFNFSYWIFQLMPDGRIDNSVYTWGHAGILLAHNGYGYTITSLTLQPDDKYLVAGYQTNFDQSLYMARYMYNVTASASSIDMIENDIAVYPNPARDYIQIVHSLNQPIQQLSIYSFDGKLLHKNIFPGNDRLDIHGLADGIYYLKLQFANHRQLTKKVIIQK